MGERELRISINGKSGRCKYPGLEVVVRVPEAVARGVGLVVPPDNGFGPRAREFGMRLSDAAHVALDEWEEADRHGR